MLPPWCLERYMLASAIWMSYCGVPGVGGDADRGGDFLLAEQRVVGQPQAELVAQDVGLLGVGLRHQHHELVAAVAGDDVGAADVLVEDAPDALQHGEI